MGDKSSRSYLIIRLVLCLTVYASIWMCIIFTTCLMRFIFYVCSEGKRSGHILYRDSKLTRILHSSLGGNAWTAIICTMSPALSHVEQTRNTLSFATNAKEVTNNAQVNMVWYSYIISYYFSSIHIYHVHVDIQRHMDISYISLYLFMHV